MFKFNFDLEDISNDSDFEVQGQSTNIAVEHSKSCGDGVPLPEEESLKEIPIQNLLDALPSLISCSPLTIPLRGGTKAVTLSRRDLFDARFQLIAEGLEPDEAPTVSSTEMVKVPDSGMEEEQDSEEMKEHRHAAALEFIEAPSDLVPRVYEGGLKTWECSIDLVEYLDSTRLPEGFRGGDILELGCGTAVPSLYILDHLFSTPPDDPALCESTIYLQDYNDSVLELVTLPNIFLTWYLSPASLPYRSESTSDSNSDILPIPTTPEPFELSITPGLKSAFLTSLKLFNISLRFFSGSWSSFATQLPALHPGLFDLVLTSETIYRMDNLPSLVNTMKLACQVTPDPAGVDKNRRTCLVAAKVLYFGVGGGVSDFVKFVEGNGFGKTQVVWERKRGVGRVILSLEF